LGVEQIRFLADLALRRGILSTRTLLLDTADAVTEGTGEVDLGQEGIQIRLRTQSKHLTVGVLPTPLLISGTLQEPRAGPDPNTPAGRGGLTRLRGLGVFSMPRPLSINGLAGKVCTTAGGWRGWLWRSAVVAEEAIVA
jgi:hypothetical protein